MEQRGYGGYDFTNGRALDPTLDPALLDSDASNGFNTEDESTTSNIQQGHTNSLRTGQADFTARTPFTGGYNEPAAQGTGSRAYYNQAGQPLPHVSNQQFPTFDQLTESSDYNPPQLPTFSTFTTREPFVAEHSSTVGWYIKADIQVSHLGFIIPIENPYGISAFDNFQPSNLATPTGPPRRRPNPPTPTQGPNTKPFADPASIPQAAIDAHGKEDREDPGTVHKSSIIRPCTCFVNRKEETKRPPNAWIMYRSAMHNDAIRHLEREGRYQGTGAPEISRLLGKWWAELPDAERKFWEQKAEKAKREHERLHPGYKYDPGAKFKQQFGTVDCKCGAYEYNMEQRRLRAEGSADYPRQAGKRGPGRPRKTPRGRQASKMSVDEDEDGPVGGEDESDAFVPQGRNAKGKRPTKKRKTGTMTSAAPFISAPAGPSRTTSQDLRDESLQDLPTPTQQMYQAAIDAGRGSREQTPSRSRSRGTPARELRRQADVFYAEPADEAFEDIQMSGTEGNGDNGTGNLDDIYEDWNMHSEGFDWNRFMQDPDYAPPAARLSGFGRLSRRR